MTRLIQLTLICADLLEGDERGDTGGEDDEEQTHDHLIGGFGIVFLPVPH